MNDVLFVAELQQRRASLWGASRERLRGLLAKAISNIAEGIESGDEASSWNLLKCLGLFGDGTGNSVNGCHVELALRQKASNQARAEEDALNDGSAIGTLAHLDFSVSARTEEILKALVEEYTEEDTPGGVG